MIIVPLFKQKPTLGRWERMELEELKELKVIIQRYPFVTIVTDDSPRYVTPYKFVPRILEKAWPVI